MKKLLTSVLLCGALLSLTACGSDESSDNSKEEELQTTIDSQSKEIKDLKVKNSELEKENKKSSDEKAQKDKKLKQTSEDNKKKDKEIEELKKVLASKKASNQQQAKVASSAQNKQQSTQSIVQQDNTTPSFANEAEAEAYYDGFIDHEKRAREISASENNPALTQDGEKIYDKDGNVLTEGKRQEIINDGGGDPVIQAETANIQLEWAKKHGLMQ